jgi:hypothetical protein
VQQILGIACPGIVYPYLRAIVSDVCTRAGFPPVVLTEVNFQAMYEAQQAQAAGAGRGSDERLGRDRHDQLTTPPGRVDEPHGPRRRGLGHRAGRSPPRPRNRLCLWARDPARRRRCARFAATRATCPGSPCRRRCRSRADFSAAVRHARGGLIVIATPMAGLARDAAPRRPAP